MLKHDELAAHELADVVYESFKAQDTAYATPRVRAGLQEVSRDLMLVATAQLVMGILAARRFREKFVQKPPTREELLDLLERYLASVASDPPSHPKYQRTVEPTRQMRALLEAWEFNLDVPEPIVTVARAWLAAYETPEPPEGWDDWPGPEDAPSP
ncbi:hypothetical protein [Sorangium sp. So ce854]|uniref:hypothetical protein n=1 Tax=Sorangium sp. So ce854 TaxID=3133322 RepID=UPI003F5E1FD3